MSSGTNEEESWHVSKLGRGYVGCEPTGNATRGLEAGFPN
jgi:hypothetical protein